MEWRKRQPRLSVWRIVAVQAVVGVLAALLALLLTGRAQWAWSVGYGGLSVVVPAALFARAMARRRTSAGAAVAAAPRLVPGLSWLALLAGMVVTMKAYWIALLARPGVRRTD